MVNSKMFISVYAEQGYNAKMALRFGFAAAVNKLTLNTQELQDAVNEVSFQ